MKVAVTGGSGQLGTCVLRRLLDDRAVKEVVSLDLRPPLVASGKLRTVAADVRERDYSRHLEGCDALVHLAYLVTAYADPNRFMAVNVEGSKNVFRAAVAAGVKTIVYASSVAAYGIAPGHPVPLVESSPRRHVPEHPYSASKFLVEEFLDGFEKEHPDVAIARLRPTILVGRRIEHALGSMLRARRLAASGTVPLPFVWDEDVAQAIGLAIAKRARGAWNLSADDPLPPAELARETGLKPVRTPALLLKAYALSAPLIARLGLPAVDPSWLGPLEATMVPSCARAKEELGWKPTCPTSSSVIKKFLEVVPRRADRRIAFFLRVASFAAAHAPEKPDLRGFQSRIHLNLTGPEGGDWTILADPAGGIRIRGGAPRPPTATVTIPARLFLDMLAGRSDFSTAYMIGRIRVDGEGHASLLVGALVSSFRAGTAAPGVRGRIARTLARAFERGATT